MFLLWKNVIGAIYENVVAEKLLAHGFESIKSSIKYLPIYMIMFIYREKPANVQFSLDLSGLS